MPPKGPKGFKPMLKDDTISFHARNPADYNEKLTAHYQVELYGTVDAEFVETSNNLTVTLKATESSFQLGKPTNATFVQLDTTKQQPPPPFQIEDAIDEGDESDGSSDTIIAAPTRLTDFTTTEQDQETDEEVIFSSQNLMSFSQETAEPQP